MAEEYAIPVPKRIQDLTGQKIGRLSFTRYLGKNTARTHDLWLVVCECGTEKLVRHNDIMAERVKSCGCLLRDLTGDRRRRHGRSHTPEWTTWQHMKSRCLNQNAADYPRYGGRGIKVCERWLGPDGFANFFADIGLKPGREYSLDRFPDVNGDYEPGNVRWATDGQQARNKRNNHVITAGGKTQTLAEWSRELGCCNSAIQRRLKDGWSEEDAVLTPINPAYQHQKGQKR